MSTPRSRGSLEHWLLTAFGLAAWLIVACASVGCVLQIAQEGMR